MTSVQTSLAGGKLPMSSAGGQAGREQKPMNDVPPAQRYQQARKNLFQQAPVIAQALPDQWPAEVATLDQRRTVEAMRLATSTANEGLLLIGLGDGSVLKYLRGDPNGRSKLIHVLILVPELRMFAHLLGAIDLGPLFKELQLSFHLVMNEGDLGSVIGRAFSNHGQIARLAGTRIIDTHALVPEAEELRKHFRPRIDKLVMERYDCLGNDVYDTFLGAKHALMHGKKIITQCRSSDYGGRYAGKSALCIASGPSVAAHYERIREIQHEHIIICADSILGGLLANGIEPDFVCMVERPDSMHPLIDAHAPKCRTTMIALPVVHPTSVIPFDERVVWFWNADDLYPWLDASEPRLSSGRSAGTITASVAGVLGVKTAWLIGHDLAFNNGQSHGAGVAQFTVECQADWAKDLSRSHTNYHKRLIDVPKNGGGTTETTGVWEIFRSDLEAIIRSYDGRTTFINVNANDQVGAVINGTQGGTLPAVGAGPLEKSHPQRAWTEAQWEAYRTRALQLREDFASVEKRFKELDQELATWRPLAHSREAVEAMGKRLDLGTIVSPDNSAWFTYVFRAALRNLMVKLHHNTFVRTMAERNWNQVQIMRFYLQSIPKLIERLRPELELALKEFT
jgi:hypothetical protein